jgi:thiamine biosynthesis lipoprotein
MFAMYRKLYDLTNGAFTPLIGQVLVDAGYDASYSLKPGMLHAPKAWDEVMTWHAPVLTTREPVQLDFGAAGKGYIVDLVGELIERDGVFDYCVDAGGDIRYRTSVGAPLRVGLENPADTKQAIGIATLGNASLCGSAGNRRAWAEFHHTINPHTLSSPKHLQAVWVIAETTLLADALTTALQFLSAADLRAVFTFEYLLLREDYSAEHSSGFPSELFTS